MDFQSLLMLLLVIALVGLVVYLIITYIPMPQPFKIVIGAIAAIVLILWIIQGGTGLRLK